MSDRYDVLMALGAALMAIVVEMPTSLIVALFVLAIALRGCCCWSWYEVMMAFGAALIGFIIKIPLMYATLVFVLAVILRAAYCCSRQSNQPSIHDTATKFIDATSAQPKDDLDPTEVTTQMLFCLGDPAAPVCSVGGKAASLMKLYNSAEISTHVPGGFALSVAFFQPWIDIITASDEWKAAQPNLMSQPAPSVCAPLKDLVKTLPLSDAQVQALDKLRKAIDSWAG